MKTHTHKLTRREIEALDFALTIGRNSAELPARYGAALESLMDALGELVLSAELIVTREDAADFGGER